MIGSVASLVDALACLTFLILPADVDIPLPENLRAPISVGQEAFLTEVVERAPVREVHIILDNLSTHKSQVVRDFLATHLNVHFYFTPTYSSWLNQVEIWFSKVERDVIARGIFTSVKDLARKLRRYINAYSANAKPIQWRYSDPTRRIRSNVVSATCH